MHLLSQLLVAIGWSASLHADAWTEIPNSRSPSGIYALFYEKLDATPNGPHYVIRFLGPGHSPASAQLIPDLHGKVIGQPGDWRTMDDFESQILLNTIASQTEATLAHTQTDPAFSSTVRWAPDSRWASIEGGARKFWHMQAWHLVDDHFQQVDLTRESDLISHYFDAHQADLQIQQLDMEQKVKAIRHRNYDRAYVDWFENGILAVDGFPWPLGDQRFTRLREKNGETYFLIDCRNFHEPKIIGVCH